MTIDIDKLEQLEKEATPGPWIGGFRTIQYPKRYGMVGWGCSGRVGDLRKLGEDGAFIAEIRNSAPELLAELRELRDNWYRANQHVEDSRRRVDELEQLVGKLLTAIDLTRQYVGEDVLTALPGWSWFDATEHAKQVLKTEHKEPE